MRIVSQQFLMSLNKYTNCNVVGIPTDKIPDREDSNVENIQNIIKLKYENDDE